MDSSKFKKADVGNKKNNKRPKRNYNNNQSLKQKHYYNNKSLKQKHYKNNNSSNKNNYRKSRSSRNNYYKRKENNKIRNSKREYLYSSPKKPKEESGINFKVIGIIIVLIAVLAIAAFSAISMLNDVSHSSSLPADAVLVYPTDFDFKPDGFYFDDSLSGSFVGTNDNGTMTYFLSKDQLFALAYNSNNTFNYSSGLYITYEKQSSIYNDINVVKDIYLEDGTNLTVPEGYDSSSFIKNSKNIASKSQYCTKSFGYSGEEYYKIV